MKAVRILLTVLWLAVIAAMSSCGGGGGASSMVNLEPQQHEAVTGRIEYQQQAEPQIENIQPDVTQGFPSFPVPSTETRFLSRADFPVTFTGATQYQDPGDMKGWTRKCTDANVDGDSMEITPSAAYYIGWTEYRIGELNGDVFSTITLSGGLVAGGEYYVLIANWARSQWDLYGPYSSNNHVFTAVELAAVSGNSDYHEDYVSSGGDMYFCLVVFNPAAGIVNSWTVAGQSDDVLAPVSVIATDGTYEDEVHVTWSHNASLTTPEHYLVFRDTDPSGAFTTQVGGRVYYPLNATIDDEVPSGSTFYYKVRAVKPGHPSSPSELSTGDGGYLMQPQPPLNVIASDGSEINHVLLTWDEPDTGPEPDEYRIYRADSQFGDYGTTPIHIVTGATIWQDTSPVGDHHYWYKVSSFKATYTESAQEGPDAGWKMPLGDPTLLVASDAGFDDRIQLNWQVPLTGPNPGGYDVFRAPSPTGFTDTPYDTSLVNSYNDTSAEALNGDTLYYKVRATKDDYQPSEFSNIDSGVIGQALMPPLQLDASDGTEAGHVHVSWIDPDTGEDPDSFNVYRCTTENGDYGTPIANTLDNFYNDPVTDGNTYFYKAKSVKAGYSDSGFSNANGGWRKLMEPTGVNASDGSSPTDVTIIWSAAATGATADLFEVYRCTTQNGDYLSNLVGTTGGNSINDPLTDGSTYWYKVRGVSNDGHASGLSVADSGYLSQLMAPGLVNATDETHPDKIVITWIDPTSGPDPDGYAVYRDTTEFGTYDHLVGNTSGNSINDESPEALSGTVYWYAVRSNKPGWDPSGLSDADSGYVGLSAPELVQATQGDHSDMIVVSWNLPQNGPNPDKFDVYRSLNPDTGFVKINTVDVLTSPYNDGDVPDGQTYYYRLKSIKSGYTDSALSNPAAAGWMTGPSAPESLTASEGTYIGYIRLEWDQPLSGPQPETYQVMRSLTSSGPFTDIGSPTSDHFYNDSDAALLGDTHYHYQVRSQKPNYTDSDPAGPVEGWKMPLQQTGTLIASDNIEAYVQLNWSQPLTGPEPDGYYVYRSTSSGDLGSVVFTINSGSTVNHQDVPTDYSQYYYTIVPFKTDYAPGPESNRDPGKRLGTPAAPDTIIASDGTNENYITISWDYSVDPADNYEVLRSTSQTGTYTAFANNTTTTNTLNDSTAQPGTVYWYKLRAHNAAGWGNLSVDDDSGWLKLGMTDDVDASDGDYTYVRVEWDPVPGADRYRIYSKADADSGYSPVGYTTGSETYYNDNDATQIVRYRYKVAAWCNAPIGEGPLSSDYNTGWASPSVFESEDNDNPGDEDLMPLDFHQDNQSSDKTGVLYLDFDVDRFKLTNGLQSGTLNVTCTSNGSPIAVDDMDVLIMSKNVPGHEGGFYLVNNAIGSIGPGGGTCSISSGYWAGYGPLYIIVECDGYGGFDYEIDAVWN